MSPTFLNTEFHRHFFSASFVDVFDPKGLTLHDCGYPGLEYISTINFNMYVNIPLNLDHDNFSLLALGIALWHAAGQT